MADLMMDVLMFAFTIVVVMHVLVFCVIGISLIWAVVSIWLRRFRVPHDPNFSIYVYAANHMQALKHPAALPLHGYVEIEGQGLFRCVRKEATEISKGLFFVEFILEKMKVVNLKDREPLELENGWRIDH